jgi:superfamily I DNA/RNA helicase
MNFEIQALGGKLIGSRSALKTLDRLTTLLPNAKLNFEVIPPPETDSDEDDDDIMHDPDIQEMVKNGEHTCHMFDAHCQACEDDEEDEEEEEDEDDITLAELKEQLEDNMTLAEIQQQLDKVEATKKRLETIRLKKENYKNYENYEEKKETFEFVDEMTRQKPASPKKADFELGGVDHVPNF